MCGLTGFLGFDSSPNINLSAILKDMTEEIRHRGPDDQGCWMDKDSQIALGHQRLSILDLSSAGKQPMISNSGDLVLIYNGEIYNHLSLRDKLESQRNSPIWKGHSDTETLLACFESWGIEKTIKESNGMFAFAVWSKKTRTLTLGRDRFGEKPLYYGWQGKGSNKSFLFGSELKSFKKHPSFEGKVSRNSLTLFSRYSSVPSPDTIYEDIYKLQPGKLLSVSLSQPTPKLSSYWSLIEVAKDGLKNQFTGTEQDAIQELDQLLKQSIKEQMISDVPLGAFLSGGVDSSTIVALMSHISQNKIKTFTIGFDEIGYNEALHAKEVANFLGTDHTELYVSSKLARDVIPKLPQIYDEPFSDSSQIPTFLVSQLAKKDVSVSLSGDGGDEIFGGYNRYVFTKNFWNKISLLPSPLRSVMAKFINTVSPYKADNFIAFLGLTKQFPNLGSKLEKVSIGLNKDNIDDLYLSLVSNWQEPLTLVKDSIEPVSYVNNKELKFDSFDPIQSMMIKDSLTYLPDDILTKVDRAAMSLSLESRVPFLNHNIFEFTSTLPLDLKVRGNETKWILRQVLYNYVPKEIIERPKVGFAVPIDNWLRGELRDWAEDLLDERKIIQEGFFNPKVISSKWNQHLTKKKNWDQQLWDVLMFQSWLREQ
tara:strand:- start:12878 stop:14827 length:1950 start_codon:yes stop_codon:yes gene_type:complete